MLRLFFFIFSVFFLRTVLLYFEHTWYLFICVILYFSLHFILSYPVSPYIFLYCTCVYGERGYSCFVLFVFFFPNTTRTDPYACPHASKFCCCCYVCLLPLLRSVFSGCIRSSVAYSVATIDSVGYRIESFDISKYRSFDISKYRSFDGWKY